MQTGYVFSADRQNWYQLARLEDLNLAPRYTRTRTQDGTVVIFGQIKDMRSFDESGFPLELNFALEV